MFSSAAAKPGPGALSFALASLMVYSVVASVVQAEWIGNTSMLIGIMLIALLVGLLFSGLRSMPGWLAHPLAIVLGLIWVVARVGPQMDPGLESWRDYASELLLRTIFWARDLQSGLPSEDGWLFLTLLALITWLVAYVTIWMIFRRGWIWTTLLLNAVLILTNMTFVATKPVALFFLFLISGLLLLVFETFRMRQFRWQIVGLEQQEFLSLRFLWTGVAVCTGLVFMSALLPTSISSGRIKQVWVEVRKPWYSIHGSWDELFGPADSEVVVGTGGANAATFSRTSVGLGGARVASNQIVMEVKAPQGEYWRSNAFDRYDAATRSWENTTGELARQTLGLESLAEARSSWAPVEPIPLLESEIQGRTPLTQTITMMVGRGDSQLPAATFPISYSLPTAIEHSYFDTGDGSPPIKNFLDTAITYSQTPVEAGLTYTVTSLISTVDQQSLRRASVDYPAWLQRYLQTPDTPAMQRITAEARRLAGNAANPYDQAVAIQNYLRSMKYNDQISAPPADRDAIEYFLFESKEGYCDYYASALVLMVRSLGIPARWVQGYAIGAFDKDRKVYIVRDTIAHSWPELYFPGYGWQRFEPTPAGYTTIPSRPVTPRRPEEAGRTPTAPGNTRDEDLESLRDRISAAENRIPPELRRPVSLPDESSRQTRSRLPIILLALAFALTLGLLVMRLLGRDIRGLSPATAAYARMGRLARWAGWPQNPSMTPSEYARDLSNKLPHHSAGIKRITSTYARERYGRDAQIDQRALSHDLRTVRTPLLKRSLRRLPPRIWAILSRRSKRRW